jgi:pyruvate formate lyase activating enzyme
MKGIVFDIQSYAIHDGPGIRTCVFFKGCPLHCAWCHNPESQRTAVELGVWPERCTGCGRCVEICPRGAARRVGKVVSRRMERCDCCGSCAAVCPNGAAERIGQEFEAREIAQRVVQDKAFYQDSSGGVTLTGGEPTWQAEFLLAVLDELKAQGIHTAVETCGWFDPDLVERLVGRVDLFLYDLKHRDDERHRRATGRGNRRILENFALILERFGAAGIVPRVPIVPGFNSDPDSLAAIAQFLMQSGYRGRVDLLPYHPWAEQKYARLDRVYCWDRAIPAGGVMVNHAGAVFAGQGLAPVWN